MTRTAQRSADQSWSVRRAPVDGRGALWNRKVRGLVLLLSTAVLSVSPVIGAHAQQVSSREGIALQDQIMELRQQLSQIQSSGAGASGGTGALPAPTPLGAGNGGSGNGDLVAQLVDRVNTLEEQQRDMRGQIEQLTNQIKEQNDALTKQIGDLGFAMQNGKGTPAPRPSPAAASDEAPAATGGDTAHADTPESYLKTGNAALLKRDYAGAQHNAESALAGAKGSAKVDAQFLLGQSLAGQKQYRQSALSYYDAYKIAPKGARAPDALLGVSASLIALGDKKAACQALGKLKSEFPSPAPRVTKAEQVFNGRASCS